MGDVGGLEGILILIFGWLVSKASGFLVTFFFMPYLFYLKKHNKEDSKEYNLGLRD